MDDEVVFEDYNIKIEEKDFKDVSKENLQKCKDRLKNVLLKINKKRGTEN